MVILSLLCCWGLLGASRGLIAVKLSPKPPFCIIRVFCIIPPLQNGYHTKSPDLPQAPSISALWQPLLCPDPGKPQSRQDHTAA